MLLPERGVVAKASVAQAAPDHGASQAHAAALQTPFKEQSRSVEQGVGGIAAPWHAAARRSSLRGPVIVMGAKCENVRGWPAAGPGELEFSARENSQEVASNLYRQRAGALETPRPA